MFIYLCVFIYLDVYSSEKYSLQIYLLSVFNKLVKKYPSFVHERLLFAAIWATNPIAREVPSETLWTRPNKSPLEGPPLEMPGQEPSLLVSPTKVDFKTFKNHMD